MARKELLNSHRRAKTRGNIRKTVKSVPRVTGTDKTLCWCKRGRRQRHAPEHDQKDEQMPYVYKQHTQQLQRGDLSPRQKSNWSTHEIWLVVAQFLISSISLSPPLLLVAAGVRLLPPLALPLPALASAFLLSRGLVVHSRPSSSSKCCNRQTYRRVCMQPSTRTISRTTSEKLFLDVRTD